MDVDRRLFDGDGVADGEVELVAERLVDDDLVGPGRVGEATFHDGIPAQRPVGVEGQQGDVHAGGRRDLHQERHHERCGALHLRELGHRGAYVLVVVRIVGQDRSVRSVGRDGVVGHHAGGAPGAGEAGTRQADGQPSEQTEHDPRPPAAAQVRPRARLRHRQRRSARRHRLIEPHSRGGGQGVGLRDGVVLPPAGQGSRLSRRTTGLCQQATSSMSLAGTLATSVSNRSVLPSSVCSAAMPTAGVPGQIGGVDQADGAGAARPGQT